jgi:transcriptional regulator with XRE-family HTH domain
MARKRTRLSDQIRAAILKSDMTRYQLWKATGVSQATLSRFVTGRGTLSMNVLDKIADALDLHIAAGKLAAPRKTKEK